ncbi:extracellular matrix protein 3-like isoform X1 [Mya arenaria]|nr:extracellular matrix protein 3-like isoform X1 [Mya arenaria]
MGLLQLTIVVKISCFVIFSLLLVECRLQKNKVILINRPVDVFFGRTVVLDPLKDLNIHVEHGDSCSLKIVNKDILPESAGKLSKSAFSCKFISGEVTYIHYGRIYGVHEFLTLLQYNSQNETFITQFFIQFNIIGKPYEVVTKNVAVQVNSYSDVSSPIDSSALQFSFDESINSCFISVLPQSLGLPQYGQLLNKTLFNIDCKQFLASDIRYRYYAHKSVSKHDYIPMQLKLLTKLGEVVKDEYFQMEVVISSGTDNTPPEPSNSATFIMDSVSQTVHTPITVDILSATDGQTQSDKLIFNITQPLGPGEGIIINTDNEDEPINHFFQYEVNDLKIAYKPTKSDSNIKRIFQIWISIVDPEGLASDPLLLMIVVEPMSTNAPVVTESKGMFLIEGQSRPIISPDMLEISHVDNLESVRIYHIDGLRHGHLTLPAGKNYFTPEDLKHGLVVYHHDDSDSLSDNIVFQLSDGQNVITFLFPVTIYPKDDQTPILIVNNGLEIQKNDIALISSLDLSASDTDTDDSDVIFVLEPPYSSRGLIIKKQPEKPSDTNEWHFHNGFYVQIVYNFTQLDILKGKMFYKHAGFQSNEAFMDDRIRFKIIDKGVPPNKSPVHEIHVKIQPIDDIPPYLYPNTKLELDVTENGCTPVKRKNLRFTDDDTNDRTIMYTIKRQPYDTFDYGPLEAGKIVQCDTSEKILTQFSQADINHNKVCFQPPATGLGLATRTLQFDFSVEDQSENILTNQVFTIIIKPVNSVPPVVINTGAEIVVNGEIVITPQMLFVKDTDPQNIVIIMSKLPQFGILYNNGSVLETDNTFSPFDIERGKIVYRNQEHDESSKDMFMVEISDGIHFIPMTFYLNIVKRSEEPFQRNSVADNGKLTIHHKMNENGTITLNPEHFKIYDTSLSPRDIVYSIQKYPLFGLLLLNGQGSSYFTQTDILNRKVMYAHTGSDVGRNQAEDKIILLVLGTSNVLLKDGSILERIELVFEIQPVDNQPPKIVTHDDIEVAEGRTVQLRREHIDVNDIDSEEGTIMCMITEQPKNGFLENKSPGSRAGLPISAFNVDNIRNGDIFYVQNVHKGIEPRSDQFQIKCSDGRNLSGDKKISIAILPANDEVPEVVVREFIGSEGMDIRIDAAILEVTDKDEPGDELNVLIVTPPKHGRIVQQSLTGEVQVQNFTLDKIQEFSTIVYEHDGSETTTDVFVFVLSDGIHNVTRTVPITIFPIDDEPPRLAVNNGLEIESLGDKRTITNEMLKAVDVDSLVSNLTFIIKKIPQYGVLTKTVQNTKVNLIYGSNFTQTDIDNNLVEYIHFGKDLKLDLIKFDVTDGLNFLINRYFYVKIKGMNMIHPDVFNTALILQNNGGVTLTRAILTDSEIKVSEELLFNITVPPKHGHLEYVDQSGEKLSNFMFQYLDSNKVRYVHRNEDEVTFDAFELEVSDGKKQMAKTLRILISGQDNDLPVVMVTTLRLKKGTNKILTPLELGVFDVDTADEDVVFTITQVPLHGNLLYNLSRIVTRFSQSDLKKGLISYQHDGSETFSDSLIFTVSDGLHQHFYIPGSDMPVRTPQEMDIEIIPMSSGAPRVVVNTGSNFLTELTSGLGFCITDSNLQSQDYDSPSDVLRYTLTFNPQHGLLRNTAQGNGAITTWTQGDLDARHIQYVLTPGENATSDSFFFKVTDQEGHSLENQPFHLQWAWLSFKTDSYHGNETDGYINVTLQRRGYLGETSLVTVEVREKTASLGRDVSRQFAQMIQFNPGQTEKQWRLAIKDDNVFEGEETLTLQLSGPLSAVLEHPYVARVTLHDPEDEATVYFEGLSYKTMENGSHLDIPIVRTGDLSQELTVVCNTRDGTARGASTGKIETFSDYITRPADHSSMVRFGKGDNKRFCRVTLLDDFLYEDQKRFYVGLSEPMGGKLGTAVEADITILPDPADEPVFYFDQAHYTVDESAGTLEVKVWKTGTDLSKPSSITVHSRRMGNYPAEVGMDYLPVTHILDFSPGQMTKTLQAIILDDVGIPQLEGPKTFELYFRIPVGGRVGQPSTAIVTIDDSVSDLPKMEFKAAEYRVLESEGQVVAKVTRSGDISSQSEVRCYTRPITAQGDMDFVEKLDSNESIVIFLPGESEADCRIQLVDDTIWEREESFRLVLGMPDSLLPGGATLGGQVTTHIVVDDPEDTPMIMFEHSQYTVNEPIIKGDVKIARISVVRLGDTMGTSEVRVTTRSGSALAGRDFNTYDRAIDFGPGVSHQMVELEIMFDNSGEDREMFTVHISQDTHRLAQVRHNSEAVVYIEENSELADIKLPLAPLVVSLRDLDFVASGNKRMPIQGYPLVCVSSCSPYHPQYLSVQDVCREAGIDDVQTKFRWRVGLAGGELFDLDSDTIFTTTRQITLDSIYFKAGSQVECFARAVNNEGEPGKEVASPVVTVDYSQGVCPSRTDSLTGAQPFDARMWYTGPDDEWHPNKVHVRVQIPHTDGMLPVISTRKMANYELTLNDDGSHKNKHQCTNLLKSGGIGAGFGVNHHDLMGFYGSSLPYEYSEMLRSNKTLALYRNLDMSSCLWTFDAYYNMSELVSRCGALMDTDSQMPGSPQSFVVVKLPLFVSYLYFTPGMRDTWRAHEVSRYLTLKFVYGTGTMWDQAIQSNRHPAGLKAQLFPSGVRILEDGRLVVRFKTVPKFRGQFLASHPVNQLNSTVQSLSHGGVTFELQLLPSQDKSDRPYQNWLVTSTTMLKNYCGDLLVTLLPCLLTFTKTSTQPISCSPSDHVTFSLPIKLQQVSDPVPAKFSLNTDFRLIRKRDVWLSEKLPYISEEDMTIAPGDTVYGRLDVSPIQLLDQNIYLYIEKVFVCAGQGGYIPLYNPDIGHYGCVGNAEQLDTVIRIMDKTDPSSVNTTFQGFPLSAMMSDDAQSSEVFNIPGADGFSFDSSPLFKAEGGKLWFLHIVFSLTTTNGDVISRTSVFDRHNLKRSLNDIAGVGNGVKGTNMAPLILDFNGKSLVEDQFDSGKRTENNESQMPLISALIGASALLLIGIFVLVIFIRHRRKQTSPPPTPSGTITVMSTSPGHTKVISNAHIFNQSLPYHSEV